MTEIQEAILMAGAVRHWSTVLNGIRENEKSFQKEVDQIFKHMKAGEARRVSSTR